MALEIPQSDRIYNLEPLPDNFDPDDPRQINATWIMRMFDKIVNGEYKMKSFKVYANFSDLPNNAEQGETAYITADEYKDSFFIYNGTSWTIATGGGSGIVDSALSTESTNPVQNKVITNRINQIAASIPIVDTTLSPTSTNPVQNKIITSALSNKQDTLPSQSGNSGKFLTTNGTTLSWSEMQNFNLFDIKLMTQPIVYKGWSCISYDEQNKLDKADVPTAYNFLKDKLDNVNGEIDDWTVLSSETYYQIGVYSVGNICLLARENTLYTATKANIGNINNWENINLPTAYSGNPDLLFGNNIGIYFASSPNYSLVVINKSTLAKITEIPAGAFGVSVRTLGVVDGYLYFYDGADGNVKRVADNVNVSSAEIVLNSSDINKICGKVGNYIYFNSLYRATDLADTTTWEEVLINGGGCRSVIDDVVDGGIIIYSGNGYYISYGEADMSEIQSYDKLNNLDLSGFSSEERSVYDLMTYNGKVYKQQNGGYILSFPKTSISTLYLYTEDFNTFTKLREESADYSSFQYSESLSVFGSSENYGYGYNSMTIIPIVYTDTYTIDGSEVEIDYYKNEDFKICVANNTNDTNLQTVFEFLGYLNYFWIDTTNQQITLQRNSNLWTFMYVGDEYEDTSLPEGNATRLLPQSELIEIDSASITLDILKNKVYKFTNSAITDITFSSNEDSTLPTTIKFTTGNSAPTFTDNSNINWVDGTPVFQANKTYQIIIFDNDGYLKEF